MSTLTMGKSKFSTGLGLSVIAAATLFVGISEGANAAGPYSKKSDALKLCGSEVRAEVGKGRITLDKTKRKSGNYRFWLTKYEEGRFKREAEVYCMVHPDKGVMELKVTPTK